MFSKKLILRASIIIGILSWVLLLAVDLLWLKAYQTNTEDLPDYLKQLLLCIFIIIWFIYFKLDLERGENINFLDLLWKAFIMGLIATIFTLFIRVASLPIFGLTILKDIYAKNILYHIILALVILFLITSFIAWKRLILYHKSKVLIKIWYTFEYGLITSLFLSFFKFSYTDYRFYIPFFFFLALSLALSVNLKWIAYINFKQKWQSILLIILTLIYTVYLFYVLTGYRNEGGLIIDITQNLFILSVFAFIALYAVFSILVTLFNLPTSSVFEQKLEEVLNFQRLSQSIPLGQDEDNVYEILMESCLNTVFADAAWMEIYDEKGNLKSLIEKNIKQDKIDKIKENFSMTKYSDIFSVNYQKSFNRSKLGRNFRRLPFGSILIVPMHTQNKQIGVLVLMKDEKDGFNKEMIDIVNTFVNQASISIENFRLLAEAIENERYKEELKIAKRVQKSLIPYHFEATDHYTISTFTHAADEVGGDYYDMFRVNENKAAFIIGDVSGKGTSAAFNMAQLKGVFHGLVQLDLSSRDFLIYANNALSRCLEKSSFVTLSFFIINFKEKTIQLARAGHCPTLYYSKKKNEIEYIQNKGMGLGIVRNDQFKDFLEVSEIKYCEGDVLLFYTDGITEARNKKGDEFGYERLKQFLEKNRDEVPELINEFLMKDLYTFCGGVNPEDDYTTMVIRFN